MKITLLVIGKTVGKELTALISDYAERVTHYIPFEMMTIPELKNTKSLSVEQQKQSEGELIIKLLQSSDYVVLLDERGKEMRSMDFAEWIEKRQQSVGKRLVFIIGGPYGFSKEVYDRKQEMLSVSKMTFSHQMIRLIFTEQLYRAMTIIKKEPYHHE